MTTPFRVNKLTLNSGDVIDTTNADIVVFVGPNNSGKSRCLQEIYTRLSLHPGIPVPRNAFFVNSEVALDRSMNADQVREWIFANRYTWTDPNDLQLRFRSMNVGDYQSQSIIHDWENARPGLGGLASHLVRGLWCAERLQYLGSPARLDVEAHPDSPIQLLARDAGMMSAFSTAFREAFGMHVVIDAWGSSIKLRVSRTETQQSFSSVSSDGMPPNELAQRLTALPLVEEQSDGVRSFAGVLLTLLTTRYPLVLLDEPEAFLHPPQARQLGRHIASLQKDGQLFVSTHSLDILLGLVEARPEKVLIVRLTRAEGLTSASVLDPTQLSDLWSDPLLRFSRSLDGLFHDGVVVGEGDTDTSFYSAIHAASKPEISGDVMFTYTGGKSRIPLVSKALRALGVPVRVIVDFDALNSHEVLKALVQGMGCDYSEEMEKWRKILDSQVRNKDESLLVAAARDSIADILNDETGPKLSSVAANAIRNTLEPKSGWRTVKSAGAAAVPSGDATTALSSIAAELEKMGIFIVPTGEVESFVKAVPGKGPKWVVEVVTGGHLDTATAAHQFVGKVMASFT